MVTKLIGATYENKYEFTDDSDVVITDAEGNAVDAGKFINVTVGDGVFKNSKLGGEYVNTLAAAYAGMISGLGAASAPTNKTIPNVKRMTYKLSLSQLDNLTAAKYVTIRQREAGSVVTSGVTCAFTNSYYSRLSTVRIMGTVIDTIVNASEPFIGEPNTIIQRNTLHTAIKSSLDALMAVGIINNYKFQLFSSAQDMVNGLINVDIEIVPAFELRKIKTTIC
jgi:phage tail sheath protein FI